MPEAAETLFGDEMREILKIEEKTQSVNLSVRDIAPRDFAATDELIYSSAGLLRSYGQYLDKQDDPTVEQENKFATEVESLVNTLLGASSTTRSLLKKMKLLPTRLQMPTRTLLSLTHLKCRFDKFSESFRGGATPSGNFLNVRNSFANA